MMKKIKPNWCGWPNQENARGIEDLEIMGMRCDAWRDFLSSETAAMFKKLKGSIIWFNKYQYFDKLICELGCSEKTAIKTIESLMRPGYIVLVDFVRNDIYDSRAWAEIPLICFADIQGNERSGDYFGYELHKNEMPVIQFGLKKKWVVDMGCFKIKHRLKDGMRFAVMTFEHSQLDSRFDGKRWVAEQMFPRETTKEEMTEALFAKVKAECVKHIVTIKQ